MKKWIILTIILTLFLLLTAVPALAADEESGESTNTVTVQNSPTTEMPDDTSGRANPTMELPGEKSPQSQREEMTSEPAPEAMVAKKEVSDHGFGHKLLLYIPNRILDIFDFVRLRVRVGPGVAVGVRATRPLTLAVGGYTSLYAGLPGPRLKPTVKFPVGIENYAGMEASVLYGSSGGRFAPNYSSTEIGVSVHPLLVGLDICVDPLEVLDLALGFVFIDIRGDDF
ncbi:MAG: hypothetical protein V2I56_02855 [Desulfobacteraceae bacterium]|jgi:hypothetical protein|nr:hypothetical protein [Desulfobacteraceae bacterium]